MTDRPIRCTRAISIRQPWAHRIVYQGKDIENRSWYCSQRGWVLIHAAKGVDPDDRDEVTADMLRGGIVGAMKITGCVKDSTSGWFSGPWGIVIGAVMPLPFIPCRGALSFFMPDIDTAGWRLINDAFDAAKGDHHA